MCTACNLSSPIITGFLFEMLVGRSQYSLQRYPAFFALFAAIYVIEPLLTRVYIKNMCAAGEKVTLTNFAVCRSMAESCTQPQSRAALLHI